MEYQIKEDEMTKEIKREEELRWQAESVVRDALTNTPAFKKAVRSTMKELKRVQKDAVKKLKGK